MTPLPRLMVAPNGARHSKSDHPNLPLTDDDVVATARACQTAGADGIHIHIRDETGAHQIDAARYRRLLTRLQQEVPGLYLQVTSEAAGRYSAQEQRDMMRKLRPEHVSVAMREMVRSPTDWPEARAFYHWAAQNNVDIQHILYSPQEVSEFVDAVLDDHIPGTQHLIQLVRGTYADGHAGAADLDQYLIQLNRAATHHFDWMLCAFGIEETASLLEAAEKGGKLRCGFENSFWNADGSLAQDNAERVRDVNAALGRNRRPH